MHMLSFAIQALAGLVFFTCCTASASLVQPDDGPYRQLRRGSTLYIYDESTRDFINSLAAINENYRALYDRSFGWNLDEEENLILTSANSQVANAFATTIPNIKTVWMPSGASQLEHMASSSWLLALASHETAHLYQLNSKGSLNSRLSRLFNHAPFIFPFVGLVFMEPNLLTPTALLEGNAVLNESRVQQGGRLHSGEARAMVLAQAQGGQLDASRLINDQFRFPFGEATYLLGGYFQAHLAAKFGADKTNQFFRAQGDHYLWPLLLNDTFRQHFGSSFYQEVREYARELEVLAGKQKWIDDEPLTTALFVSPLNHDRDKVWWLEGRTHELPTLVVYDKTRRLWENRAVDLPWGKVFFENDRPLSAASQQNDLRHITYSLFGEGALINPRFQSQIVTDRRAGHSVAFDAKNSWLDPAALLDGQLYDFAHSNPILDAQGNVYYFRQNGAQRLLYRNRQPLIKFEGYYGKLTEVTDEGAVLFIGSTDFGSSLFALKDGELWRMLDSDRIVDARHVQGDDFLAVEVAAEGHRVHLIKSHPRPSTPAVYNYAFTSVNPNAASAAPRNSSLREVETSYNSFSETRFSSLNWISRLTPQDGLSVSLSAQFTDPLQYHQWNLGFSHSSERDRTALVEYTFTKNLPRIFTRYMYLEQWYQRSDGAARRTHNQELALGVELPLLRYGRWDADLRIAGTFETEERMDLVTPSPSDSSRAKDRELYGTLARVNLSHIRPMPASFFNHSEFQLTGLGRFSVAANDRQDRHLAGALYFKFLRALPDFFLSHKSLNGGLG